MSRDITLKRGINLPLAGGLTAETPEREASSTLYAICPEDFEGFLPKVEVKEGDSVKCGTPILRDKEMEDVKLVSPVAGTVEAVVRGERRRILRVVVKASATPAESVEFAPNPSNETDATTLLKASGLWAMMRQRPYDIVPREGVRPRDIFVTGFDSAPLAPNLMEMTDADDLKVGVRLLKLLTDGTVYFSVRPENKGAVPEEAETVVVNGPHPAGNAGVQAANIAPINKGETIWTLDAVTLSKIGYTARTGRADWSVKVAVTGSEVETPEIVKTFAGASILSILGGDEKSDGIHHRIISGNVLTGRAVGVDNFLRYPYRQVTVIAEGDDRNEFMGWASMSPNKMSVSASFPSHFLPGRKFSPDARLQGGRRAMIMSGLYEKVLPMDIMAEYLLKAIIARDIDKMEALGIYEVAPEDFALCEYIDPSKLEVQKIVREGLDYLRKETE